MMAQEPQHPGPDPKTTDSDASKVGHTEHGIPPNAGEEEPTGYPTSDRHQGEIAPAKP